MARRYGDSPAKIGGGPIQAVEAPTAGVIYTKAFLHTASRRVLPVKVSARARCRWHLSCAARVGVGTSAVQHVSSSAPQLCSSRFRRRHFSCAAIRIVVGTSVVQHASPSALQLCSNTYRRRQRQQDRELASASSAVVIKTRREGKRIRIHSHQLGTSLSWCVGSRSWDHAMEHG